MPAIAVNPSWEDEKFLDDQHVLPRKISTGAGARFANESDQVSRGLGQGLRAVATRAQKCVSGKRHEGRGHSASSFLDGASAYPFSDFCNLLPTTCRT